jgi:hypothetical protein
MAAAAVVTARSGKRVMTRRIPIDHLPTVAHMRERLNYDPKTGLLTWRHYEGAGNRRLYRNAGRVAGCLDGWGYIAIKVTGRMFQAHRIAWAISTGNWPDHEIDHINGDRTDNRFCNLRNATRAENARNTKLYNTNKSGYKGVCFRPSKQKFAAHAWANGRQIYLGLFATAEDAAAAYANFALKHHGEFARASSFLKQEETP